jgi:hypothetical protein
MDLSGVGEQFAGIPGVHKSPRLQSGDNPAGGLDIFAYVVVIGARVAAAINYLTIAHNLIIVGTLLMTWTILDPVS